MVVFLTKNSLKLLQSIVFIVLFSANSHVSANDLTVPFEAVYQVLIDGKPRMETKFSLRYEDDMWIMKNEGRGTKGLAKILHAKSSELSKGTLKDGTHQSGEYSQNSEILGAGKQWTATIDWENQQISTTHEDGNSQFATQEGAVDPLTLTLALRQQLTTGAKEFSLNVISEQKISQQDFAVGEVQSQLTPLGCFNSVLVKRLRENSTRYSSGWYSKSLSYIPIKIVHGKEGGREFELQITHLTINGKEIEGNSDCP